MAMGKACFSAGHGLSSRVFGQIDPGAVKYGRESDINLGMAKRLSQDWAAMGYPVLVRDTGKYDMADNDAYNNKCQIFVELHLNAGAPAANGVETFIAARASAAEKGIAYNICKNIAAVGFRNRGMKSTTSLAVLRQYSTMDSVLVETCFITNRQDMERYQKNVDKIELAILNGILIGRGVKPVKTLPRTWSAPRKWLFRITKI